MLNPKCSNCNSDLKIKNHKHWIGFYCPSCKSGGSVQKDKAGNADFTKSKAFTGKTQSSSSFTPHIYKKKIRSHNESIQKSRISTPQPIAAKQMESLEYLKSLPQVKYDPNVISYTPENQLFSMYISEIMQVSDGKFSNEFVLVRPDTGSMMQFKLAKTDATDGEVEGFWFHGTNKNGQLCKFLIIND